MSFSGNYIVIYCMIIFRKNDNEHLFPKIIIMSIYVSLYFFLLTLWFLRASTIVGASPI